MKMSCCRFAGFLDLFRFWIYIYVLIVIVDVIVIVMYDLLLLEMVRVCVCERERERERMETTRDCTDITYTTVVWMDGWMDMHTHKERGGNKG